MPTWRQSVLIARPASRRKPGGVGFTLVNRGASPVYVARCNGMVVPLIDRLSWGNWRYEEARFCNGGQTTSLELAPGGSIHGSVAVYNSGAYRFRVSVVTSRPTQESITSSQAFDIWQHAAGWVGRGLTTA